jgi:hypothetical protein
MAKNKDFMAPKNTEAAKQPADACKTVTTYGEPSSPGLKASTTSAQNENLKTKKVTITKDGAQNAGAGRGFVNPPFVKPESTYPHQTENIVTNADTSDSSFGKVNINAQFLPNVLDSYDAVTYHFKLFITDPDTSSSGQVFQTDKQIIIAESGVTDLIIDKVEIRAVTTPTTETGTGVATFIKFEITEPGGAGMIDKLFYQSVALGIGNWATMPVYLQMQFRGRDPLTSSPDDGSPGALASLKWLWPMKIGKIKTNVTHAGTKYEFEAVYYNDFAQSNANFSLQHNTVLRNLSNFQDAMVQLQNKLNGDQIMKLIDNYSIPDSYRIIVDPELAGCTITPANQNTNSRRNSSFITFENKDASFGPSTSIDVVIDSLLAQTEEFQKGMLSAPVPGAEGDPMTEEPSQMKDFWRIITETRPLRFDPMRQEVAREFTIFVIKYDIGVLDQNVFQTSAPPDTIEAQRKRLMTYVKKSILKKKYNYIFTGLNDQVINFDITINNAWANAQARFGGIYLNPFMTSKGVVTHDHAADERAVTEAVSHAISFQNSATTSDSEAAKTAMEDARNSINNSNLDDARKERIRILLEQSKPENRLNYIRSVQRGDGIQDTGTLNSARTDAVILSTPITEKMTGQQFNFLSDVDIKAQNTQEAYNAAAKNSRGKLRPIARIETLQDRQVGLGIEASSNSGLQKLSTMFSVALHSAGSESFQRIKMTIKGDPFWLFPPPFANDNDRIFTSLLVTDDNDPRVAINFIKKSHFKHSDSANLYGTDNFILVRFRTPRIIQGTDAENNADANSEVETLSGVYKVNYITNSFENGKFTQELDCILDPEIRILDILDQIEDDAKNKDKIPAARDLIPAEMVIPGTAIKKDRILGSTIDSAGTVVADSNSNARDRLLGRINGV